ncbi:MotA/TolQ/ExbB proton channel family protein [Aliterella atlantica]|uniref:Flagellar motor protein MotA n=1 Tax=Aliterella atlantica CENA595 TaxID=1618023 RepID=A0A0D8ZNB9_9CYAN|nr:MotA/TolQ/ExbB proton channel family protein [Aliterella atlantica]KJH70240.1 flagellar motor protein MotA [Aliterella atlantica CENA595]
MVGKIFSKKITSKSRGSERQELSVQIPIALAIAFGLTAIVYGVLLPIRTSYLGVLLYDRGFTQHLVIFLSWTVLAFAALKFIKLQKEFLAINQDCIPQNASLENPNSQQVNKLQQSLLSTKNLLAVRCSRVLAAYIHSGNRKTATELALDDSSFYASVSESSYSIPRIFVWAIPLLGFIGTVLGISNAVNGFSSFLSEAAEIEQIKQGISTVTTGLAIGFDTTLLALCLSVLVMIPLVVIERFESRLLLAIDIYINEKLLPRLRDKSNSLDEKAITKAVTQALNESLPEPEDLIEPAHTYAKQAAAALAKGFLAEIGKVQNINAQLIEQLGEVSQTALKDRQDFVTFFEQQQQASQTAFTNLVSEIRASNRQLLDEFKAGNSSVAMGLTEQAEKLCYQLEQAAKALDSRVVALEKSAVQVLEIVKLQQSLEQTVNSLEQTAQLEHVLVGVRENLAQISPVLEQLSRPRRITLVERDERSLNGYA